MTWLTKLKAAADCFRKPADFLQPPPAGVSLDHLIEAREQLTGERGAPTWRADLARLRATVLDLALDRNRTDSLTTLDVESVRDGLVGGVVAKVAGPDSKDRLTELLHATLVEIDRHVELRLRRGGRDGRVIPLCDIDAPALSVYDANGGRDRPLPLVAVVLDRLPEGHPLRQFPETYPSADDGRPCVALGPCQKALNAVLGLPKPFYLTETSLFWTRSLRKRRLARLREAITAADLLRMPADDAEAIRQALDNEAALPPRPPRPAPVPIPKEVAPDPRDWSRRFIACLTVLRNPQDSLAPPPEETTLADLLTARALFISDEFDRGIDELLNVLDPAREGSARFASLCAGLSRRDELLDLIGESLIQLDRRLDELREKGLRWAVLQALRDDD
jgi:hypothetical protein